MAKTSVIVRWKNAKKFKVREYTRCQACGRPRGVYAKFMLCRICFRGMAHKGLIPGVMKSSW